MDLSFSWLGKTPSQNPFPGLEAAFHQMNPIALGACGFLLFVAFVFTCKYLGRRLALQKADEENKDFEETYEASAHALAVFQDQRTYPGSPAYNVYEAGCRELSFHLLGTDTVDNSFAVRLLSAGRITPSHMEAVRRAMERKVVEGGRLLETGLRSAGVTALPFLGLLGTLLTWLEDSSNGGGVSVAAALFPMVLSVLLYLVMMPWHNALVRRARAGAAALEDFAAGLSGIFDRTYVDHRKPLESLPSLGMMDMNDAPNFSMPPSDSAASTGMAPGGLPRIKPLS